MGIREGFVLCCDSCDDVMGYDRPYVADTASALLFVAGRHYYLYNQTSGSWMCRKCQARISKERKDQDGLHRSRS